MSSPVDVINPLFDVIAVDVPGCVVEATSVNIAPTQTPRLVGHPQDPLDTQVGDTTCSLPGEQDIYSLAVRVHILLMSRQSAGRLFVPAPWRR